LGRERRDADFSHDEKAYKETATGDIISYEYANTNAINLITSNAIAPHPIPLPSGERGR